MKLEIICPETSSQCLFFLFYYQTDVRESVWTTTPFKNTHCISSVWLFWLWRHPESTFTATLWLYRFVDATWTLEPELLRSLWREQRANTTAAAGPAAPGLKTKTIRTVEVWRCSKSPSGGEMRGFSVTFSPRQCQVCASLQMLSNETLSRNTVSQPPPSSSSSSPLPSTAPPTFLEEVNNRPRAPPAASCFTHGRRDVGTRHVVRQRLFFMMRSGNYSCYFHVMLLWTEKLPYRLCGTRQ